MCEQSGQEIDWERCPPDEDDFPDSVNTAIEIFNNLGDRIYPDVGYTGKDFTNLTFMLEAFYITEKVEKDYIVDLLLFLEKETIKRSQEQLKARYARMKK